MNSIGFTLTTGFYVIYSIMVLVAGLLGYSRFKSTGWIMIFISGIISVIVNSLSFVSLLINSGGGDSFYSNELYSSVTRVLFLIESICLVTGLLFLANARRKQTA
jgi:hypothetical protein